MQITQKRTFLYSLMIISTFATSLIFGQDDKVAPKYSNEFLQIGVGADALGMSNAVVANTGSVNSGYWNPAGLIQLQPGWEISAMHSEYFAGIAKYDYVGIAKKIDRKSAFGISFIRFAVDDIPNTTQLIDNAGNIDYDRITTFTAADYALLFSYARHLKVEGLSFGGNFKVIHRKVGDFAKSWGFGIDGGLQYDRNNDWKFGLMVRDVTSTFNAWVFNLNNEMREVFIKTGNEIPQNGLELTLPRFIGGAHRHFDLGEKGIFLGAELDLAMTTDGRRNTIIKTPLVSIDPHLGVEIGYKKLVALRMGVSNFQQIKNFDDSKKMTFQPNVGIGVNLKNFSLDYAFTDIGDQSTALYSHVISLRLKIIGEEEVIKLTKTQ
jgi:hypothetical protein